MTAERTRAEKVALNRIALGLLPYRTNNPATRALIRKLEGDGLTTWSPKGWTLTDSGRAAIAVKS